MKEAPGSSETSVLTRATRRNNSEDTILHSHRRENLKSYKLTRVGTLWLMVSWPVFLGVEPHVGPTTRSHFFLGICEFVEMGRPLWREDGSVVYACIWSSSSQLDLAELMTKFHFFRFQISPIFRARPPYLHSTGEDNFTGDHICQILCRPTKNEIFVLKSERNSFN
jgi:hypothetical protein